MAAWAADERGNCWEKCKARTPETGLCENLAAEAPLGKPCPLLRLRVGLGRERVA
jgi:hypothetical protein